MTYGGGNFEKLEITCGFPTRGILGSDGNVGVYQPLADDGQAVNISPFEDKETRTFQDLYRQNTSSGWRWSSR